MNEPSGSLLTTAQQQQILDALIGQAGMTRIQVSVLVSRAGAPPSRRDSLALDEAGMALIQWLTPLHVGIALYELMLEEKILLDFDPKEGIIARPMDGAPSRDETAVRDQIGELIVSHVISHFGKERAAIEPIPYEVYEGVRDTIDLAYQASGQIESLAPTARRDNDAKTQEASEDRGNRSL